MDKEQDKNRNSKEQEDGGPSMSLWEHLDELRKRIFYALLGLVVSMVLACFICKPVIMPLIQNPYHRAMSRIVIGKNRDLFEEKLTQTGRNQEIVESGRNLLDSLIRSGATESEAQRGADLFDALAATHRSQVNPGDLPGLYSRVVAGMESKEKNHVEMIESAIAMLRTMVEPPAAAEDREKKIRQNSARFHRAFKGVGPEEIRLAVDKLREKDKNALPGLSLVQALMKAGNSPAGVTAGMARMYHLMVETSGGVDDISADMEICRDSLSSLSKDLEKTSQSGQMIGTNPIDGFVMFMKMSLVGGLILSAPWIFWQVWQFVGVGLYRKERMVIRKAFPFSAGMFVAGAVFYLFVVGEEMMYFLFQFNNWFGVQTLLKINEYVGLVLMLMVVFGLSFQLPIVLAVLGRVGIISSKGLADRRRYVIVGLFIFAALVTSPSPVDQVLLALPMWALYELGILLVRLQEKKRGTEEEEEEESLEDVLAGLDEDSGETGETTSGREEPETIEPDLNDPDFEDPWPDYDDYTYENYGEEEDEFGLWGRGDGDLWNREDEGLWGGDSDTWINPLLKDPDEKEG